MVTVSIQPEFSVVITCFNKESKIEGAIRSAKAQSLRCEIIIVDDCSIDGSREALAQFSDINVILHDVNKGALQAYLTGMRVAQGRFIVMLDGDDELSDGILEGLSNAKILDDSTSLRMGMATRKDADAPTGGAFVVRVKKNVSAWVAFYCDQIHRRRCIYFSQRLISKSRSGVGSELARYRRSRPYFAWDARICIKARFDPIQCWIFDPRCPFGSFIRSAKA